MRVAVTPAWPGKLVAGFHELQIVVRLNPCVAFFGEHNARLTGVYINKIKINLVLRPIEHRGPGHAILYPAKARNVHVFFTGQVEPLNSSAFGANHAELDFRVW